MELPALLDHQAAWDIHERTAAVCGVGRSEDHLTGNHAIGAQDVIALIREPAVRGSRRPRAQQ